MQVLDRRDFLRKAGGFLCASAVALPMGSLEAARPDGSERSHSATAPPRFRFLLSDPEYVYSRPCFSPSGDRILFMRAPATDDPVAVANSNQSPWSLWTVPARGGFPTLLFEDPEIRATRPDWSWTTNRIAFTGIAVGGAALFTIDENGDGLTHIPVGDPARTAVFYPSWYPDGDCVAVTDYTARQVLRVSIDGSVVEPLTNPSRVWAGMASVSPDSRAGNPLAFAGQKPGRSYDSANNVIWIQHPGEQARPLDGEHGRTPSWSPSGERLAFTSDRGRPAPSFVLHRRELPPGSGAIFVQPFEAPDSPSGSPIAISPFDWVAVHAKWSPDGRTVVCMAQSLDTGERGLAVIELPKALGGGGSE